ncbi:MAG: fibronectin type III domain-containing protein [Vicinamibacterales bacterium]
MTRRMRAVAVVSIALGLLASALAAPAEARQSQPSALYVIHNDLLPCQSAPHPQCVTTRVTRATVGPDSGRVDWVRDVPNLFDIKEAYVTPDGGTLAYLGVSLATGPGVYLHDVVSGRTTFIGPFHGATILLGNPVRPEVYLFDGTGATVLSPSGTRRIGLPCRPNDRAGISADGQRVSITVVCGALPDTTLETTVFDTMTGAVLSTQPYYGKVSADGDVLFTRDFVNGVPLLQRRDVVTGQVLTEVTNPGWGLVVDRGAGDVVSYGGSYAHLADGRTLAVRWSTLFGASGAGDNGPEPVIDPSNGMLFAATLGGGVSMADTRGRRLLGYVGFPAQMWAQLAVGPPAPQAPVALGSAVTGSAVALTWSAPAHPATVTRYVIEVGSAPGSSDIFSGLDVGLQTSFAAAGVPPGTYYVRVRAGNDSGLSAPSNEVVVTVP